MLYLILNQYKYEIIESITLCTSIKQIQSEKSIVTFPNTAGPSAIVTWYFNILNLIFRQQQRSFLLLLE